MAEDYFERLGMPQSPVIDELALKESWHRAAAQAENPEDVHRAYAVLRDQAKRIEHLLTLHGQKTVTSEQPGATLFDLFFTVAAALKTADEIGTRISEAATALQRAGLTNHLFVSLDELTAANQAITVEENTRSTQLNSLASHFPNLSCVEWEILASLGNDFAFLTKWETEIQKRTTKLQETLMGKIA